MVGRKVPARALHKLTDRGVKGAAQGYHGDGGGLWLQVSSALTRSWIFRYTLNGRSREMGLGSVNTVSLAEARFKAHECRQQLLEHVDPIEARQASRQANAATSARAITFDQCSERYIEAHRSGWKNAKHADQWTNTLAEYASPNFGRLNVALIDTALVMKAIEPIWLTKTETAKRVRGRIEAVLAWATVRGYRSGDNPARWRHHLDQLLVEPGKVSKVEHHAALPYGKVGEFMQALRAEASVAARAVEFIVLTAARTSEAFNADWQEIDLDAKVWTVPAERMKAKRDHRVPLSPAAVRLLTTMAELSGRTGPVFPGAKEGKGLSNMAGLKLLQRMGLDVTVHGFRSTFRDWAAEQSNYPREVAEAALAHVLKDKTEAAYQRGDLFAKRAKMMDAWANYCGRVQADAAVTTIRAKKA